MRAALMDGPPSQSSPRSSSEFTYDAALDGYQYDPYHEALPPTGYSPPRSRTSSGSDTGSLYGYCDRVVNTQNDRLYFTAADGGAPSFGQSADSLPRYGNPRGPGASSTRTSLAHTSVGSW